MELKEINLVLTELEKNLRDLESAREQVKKVSLNSDKVNNSTKELIEIIREFVNNDYKVLEELTDTLENFKNNLQKSVKTIEEKTNHEIQKFIDNVEKVSKNFEQTTNKKIIKIDEAINALNKMIDKQNEEFDNIKQFLFNKCKTENKRNLYLFVVVIIFMLTDIMLKFFF